MLWDFFKKHDALSRAEAIRRTHERWLTRALGTRRELPRIPVRRVDEGGFEAMMADPAGRLMARAWWDAALEKVPDASDFDGEQ